MLRKLILLIISVIFITGCGASAPNGAAEAAPDTASLYRADGTNEIPQAVASEPGSGPLLEASESAATPASTECQAEYFRFTSATNTISDGEGNTLLYERQSVPEFVSEDPERSGWVNGILNGINQDYASNSSNLKTYAEDFLEMNGSEYFYSHSNYQQLGIARHDDKVVSLIVLSSLYSGGSHPNSVQTAYNLDIEGQRILCLEDIISEEGAPALAALVLNGVEEKFAAIGDDYGLFEDYADTIENSMVYGVMTPYWYLNDTGLVIFYNQYELGPYASGIIKVELPYGELEGILLEEYLPVSNDGTPGGLVLRGDWEGYHRIPIVIETEGETLMVGVEGQVWQVQLSEVQWLEDMPIAQDLLFSAMTLCQNDVLEITGGYTDDGRSFAIEFTDGEGERRILYIHDGELSEKP